MTAVPGAPRRLRRLGAAPLLAFLALPFAASAHAQVAPAQLTTNWAGYVDTGASFTRVSGAWTVPTVICGGRSGSSANWVGLGGDSATSQALEQAGTESDCAPSGRHSYSAWWEMLPDVPHTARLAVRPGDRMTVSVVVQGLHVTVRVGDSTRHTFFKRSLNVPAVDVSSADWIVEAPSACSSPTRCTVLPLANFGSTTMARAQATDTTGHTGTIPDPRWQTQALTLAAGRSAVSLGSAPGGLALPGPLSADGGSFSVTFAGTTRAVRRGPAPAAVHARRAAAPGRGPSARFAGRPRSAPRQP